jgi:hypothetical protein
MSSLFGSKQYDFSSIGSDKGAKSFQEISSDPTSLCSSPAKLPLTLFNHIWLIVLSRFCEHPMSQ